MIAAVSFDHITKRFPGVLALEDVSFSIAAGTCHALCGENGAGKSTLGKILAGIYRPDAGHVEVSGTRVDFSGPQQALAAGIGIVHQELAFCDNLSVAENLCLGALPARHTFVSRGEMARRAREMLAATGADIDVTQLVRELTRSTRQRRDLRLLRVAEHRGERAQRRLKICPYAVRPRQRRRFEVERLRPAELLHRRGEERLGATPKLQGRGGQHSSALRRPGQRLQRVSNEIFKAEIRHRHAEVFGRDVLERVLYGGEGVQSNALEVHVHSLRKKTDPALIRTVRGIGYLLEDAS